MLKKFKFCCWYMQIRNLRERNMWRVFPRRVRLHERRNQLKPVWEFILVENLTSALYLCSHELRRNEIQAVMEFVSVILGWTKFQTSMKFSCEQNLMMMMMMMIMIKMMNFFCGMVDHWKAFSLISSQDHCQSSSPSQISNPPQAGFEQNLPKVKWISADLLDIAFDGHVCLKLITVKDFILVILTEIKFHFWW